MTSAATPAYLGGIGLMLEVAQICPRCGKHVPDAPSAAGRHLASNGCRPPVYAALPEPEPEMEQDVPLVPVGRRIHDFEVPISSPRKLTAIAGVEPVAPAEPARRGIAIPWLRPPDLGEVL